ncbi:hypothetical protein MAPG_09304 [Magnaporthiopsis poae ATCC 64411]|uniref:Uncharacterized protein n=1 Tax=Magnaporthiopsis poae (strain ATCC 64411 / 73-15) TaxID=644358 RepID=A0A0C4E9L1_MAGP6|nr:hypothetical protein MAPG_09304 [Magnaporthiopsis poae ATCC 64411]
MQRYPTEPPSPPSILHPPPSSHFFEASSIRTVYTGPRTCAAATIPKRTLTAALRRWRSPRSKKKEIDGVGRNQGCYCCIPSLLLATAPPPMQSFLFCSSPNPTLFCFIRPVFDVYNSSYHARISYSGCVIVLAHFPVLTAADEVRQHGWRWKLHRHVIGSKFACSRYYGRWRRLRRDPVTRWDPGNGKAQRTAICTWNQQPGCGRP